MLIFEAPAGGGWSRLTVLPPSAFVGWPRKGKAKMGTTIATREKPKPVPVSVRATLRKLHQAIRILPATKRRMLHEKLREKVATDIVEIMKETETPLKMLAAVMRMSQKKMKEWIWTRDLTLSELVRILNYLDSEAYFIIRPRKGEVE